MEQKLNCKLSTKSDLTFLQKQSLKMKSSRLVEELPEAIKNSVNPCDLQILVCGFCFHGTSWLQLLLAEERWALAKVCASRQVLFIEKPVPFPEVPSLQRLGLILLATTGSHPVAKQPRELRIFNQGPCHLEEYQKSKKKQGTEGLFSNVKGPSYLSQKPKNACLTFKGSETP